MTQTCTVLHLVDDTTAGGVTRVIDQMVAAAPLAACAHQRVLPVTRGRFGALPKDVDIIVSHTAISWRTLPALMALRATHPNVTLIHVEHSYTEGFVVHNVTRTRRFFGLLKIAFSLFDRVIAVSEAQADWMRRHELCSHKSLTTIPSWVDLSPFRDLTPPRGPIRTLGAIGRLDTQKGFDRLIAAFQSLPDPDLRLRIIGKGPQEKHLRQLAGTDPRIVFAGFADTPTDAYADVDAVVMPSRWEAFGLVATEALAAGRPVLCANVDGLRDHDPFGAQLIQGPSARDLVLGLRRMLDTPYSPRPAQNLRHREALSVRLWQDVFLASVADRTGALATAAE
ncbi:glycosyltransferase family 4 protein [Pseudooctadecabacter jejudonensis]|uniref:Mannosylfructose-phosphate synthase n=1 Tax=Pseudooctadecabacter jejudonensis TaxID=1391910 RepID=A0A1Y5S164_9RHOB|nr:glycosyltransferase family 4 protein [Pseudooctadecabacter jejudonensis]SLN27607.1 Mannosylfructose-phosphate synthase [Pseudooctadecabacter jejudonensis]